MYTYPIINSEVLSNEKKLIKIRRLFHENPEVGYKEFQTSAYISEFLEKLGIEVIKEVGKTGVVGILKGNSSGPTILLRADMDALPIQETTYLPFQSKNLGIHHACGHDGHMAILLITAQIIAEKYKNLLKGNIKFVFQPAEEGGFGARSMILDSKYPVLENPKVDHCFGLHLLTIEELGKIQIKEGFFSAFSFPFTIKIKSGAEIKKSYVSNAILIAVKIIKCFYSITSRNINPNNKSVISIGKINGGAIGYLFPSDCEFSGTFRCIEITDKDIIVNKMNEIINGYRLAFKVQIDGLFEEGYPGIYNHPKETKILLESCVDIVGKENISDSKFGLYGEDFSFYVENTPGAFFLLGAAPENSLKGNKTIVHHSPNFTFNEKSLMIGVSVYIKLIEKLLIY